jgi:hypothetical protein
MENYYNNKQEIEAVVAGFEKCTTSKEEFTHLSHLTVATYYLRHSTPHDAFEKMRDGLLRFLDHHGIGRAKYKERLTRDWIALVHGTLEKMDPETSLVDATKVVIDRLGKFRIPEDASRETL